MKNKFIFLLLVVMLLVPASTSAGFQPKVKLGNEVLLSKYRHLVEGKKVGLVTNQTGIDSRGKSLVDILAQDPAINLVSLYSPEHGLDGQAKAGEYVESYTHRELGIPVYSLYGASRMPTEKMLSGIDVLLFDIQDIGARSYTYMSTLNYCLVACQKYGKPLIVLDRPNPLGGIIVEGPVLEDPFISFVGVDNLPMAHGMTAGELALFFNRKIGADLKVIPMEGYHREMIFQDTGLPWVPTSPNIPDLDSAFGYMATGLGEGTGIYQADKFKWIGGKGIDSQKFADLLNNAGLPGVRFIPEAQGQAGGARLQITDYHSFNPAKTGLYALCYAHSLTNFKVPKSGSTIVMFDKIMGTDKIGQYLEQGLSPQEIEAKYKPALNRFKEERKKYLLYSTKGSSGISVVVQGKTVEFDVPPYLDQNNRLQVPIRAIAQALGGEVYWQQEQRTITIIRGEDILLFRIDDPKVMVNGLEKTMDTVPILKNNRTLIPVRYVGEYLHALVHWDQAQQTVFIYQ
ncbi:MAG: exo-beta-N-acetylmuramidase NamZ domain-containing protein [Bacillota bacterium]